MFLSVKEMEVRKIRFDEVFQPGAIDFTGTDVQQRSPLHATGTAELLAHTGGELRVRGHLDVQMEAECDRCLGRAQIKLDAPFDLFYRPAQDVAVADEVSLEEGETELGFYEGEGFPLEDLLREQVMLLLPMQLTCRPDCQGICPVCGANRNEKDCQCVKTVGDSRWDALRGLAKN